jgi:pyruvate,orthophosphate dikinase
LFLTKKKTKKKWPTKWASSVEEIKKKVEEFTNSTQCLGHRGCRLGNTYPEITEMQARAIIEAALELKAEGVEAMPEIMIPLIGTVKELKMQEEIVRSTMLIKF